MTAFGASLPIGARNRKTSSPAQAVNRQGIDSSCCAVRAEPGGSARDLFSLNNAVGLSSAVAAPPAEAEHVEVRRAIFRAWILGPRA
jgi:hypothetical protein